MFKKDQRVWCAIYGQGVVTEIQHESEGIYRVDVKINGGRSARYTSDGRYYADGNVVLFPHPIEIVKAVIKPSIEWDHVSENFKYLVMDGDGQYWLTKSRPTTLPSRGRWTGGDVAHSAGHFASLVPGNCDWQESLVERPS